MGTSWGSSPAQAAGKKGASGAWSPAPGLNAFESMIPGQSEVSGALYQAILSALQGQFPEEYFSQAIANPMRDAFNRESAPAIREEFAGPGTFWGTARGDKVTGERGRMEEGISAKRAGMAYQTQQQALAAALQYLGIPLMAAYQPYDEGDQVGGSSNNALLNALKKPKPKPSWGTAYNPGNPGIYAGPTPTL